MRVLFAEDHVMMREALKPHIQRIAEDVEVDEAGTAADVVERLRGAGPYDLVIIDLRMPGMHGLDSLEAMMVQHPQTRFVVLSAISDTDCIAQAMRMGVAGFIPKHLSTAQMRGALQLVLAGERYVPSVVIAGRRGRREEQRGLTQREAEILPLIREGLSNKTIAHRLGVGEVTVKTHVGNLLRKLKLKNRTEIIHRLDERDDG